MNFFAEKNIFFSIYFQLGDLGFSKILQGTNTLIKGNRVGTPLFLSPEIIKMKPYDFKVENLVYNR